MPDTNIHGRSGSDLPPCSPAWAARPIRHETHLAVCVHPKPARGTDQREGSSPGGRAPREAACHLGCRPAVMEQRARCRPLEAPTWVSEPISSRALLRETRDSHRLSSTGISPMAQATPVSRRCALWPRPSSPPSAGRGQRMRVRRMTGRLSCGTPRPRERHRARTAAARR
jgi:hypothetical protein